MKTEILLPTEDNIRLAAAEIKNGGLVAFPTETVYGLGANALSGDAAKSIFLAKGRPSDNPLIVHLSSKSDIESVAFMTEAAQRAAEIFMPGPLTVILKKKECVPDAVTGGLNTVAVRIPNHPVALRFLKECGTPVAAPSANTSTRPSPTRAAHVFADLDGKIRYILDGGSCDIGIESTILDLSGDRIRLLRRGGISEDTLREVFGDIEVHSGEVRGGEDRPLSPGMKYRHYAPRARVRLFESGDKTGILAAQEKNRAAGIKTLVLMLGQGLANLSDGAAKNSGSVQSLGGFFGSAVSRDGIADYIYKTCNEQPSAKGACRCGKCDLSGGEGGVPCEIIQENFVVFNSAEEYANALFYQLRRSDEIGCGEVLCELAPAAGIGESINNRLKKASQTEEGV